MSDRRSIIIRAIALLVITVSATACAATADPGSSQTAALEQAAETAVPIVGAAFTETPTPTEIPTEVPTEIPTSTPAPTDTPTTMPLTAVPTPNSTPTPQTIPITGRFFYDRNGNGLQEAEEESLADLEICVYNLLKMETTDDCAITDGNGAFVLQETGTPGDDVYIKIAAAPEDYALDTVLRYVNEFVQEIVVPKYEMNGVTVSKQHLSETTLEPIDNKITIFVGEENSIGLTSGWLLYPVIQGDYYISSFLDHEPIQGYVLDWKNDRKIHTDCGPDYCPANRTHDQHLGTDFEASKGQFVVATADGVVNNTSESYVLILHNIEGTEWATGYGHLDQVLVERRQRVQRGQIIGTNGLTGTSHAHVHFDLENHGTPYDPFGHPEGDYPQRWIQYLGPELFP